MSRKIFLDSFDDREQARSYRDDQAQTLVNIRKAPKYTVSVEHLPGTGAWAVFLYDDQDPDELAS